MTEKKQKQANEKQETISTLCACASSTTHQSKVAGQGHKCTTQPSSQPHSLSRAMQFITDRRNQLTATTAATPNSSNSDNGDSNSSASNNTSSDDRLKQRRRQQTAMGAATTAAATAAATAQQRRQRRQRRRKTQRSDARDNDTKPTNTNTTHNSVRCTVIRLNSRVKSQRSANFKGLKTRDEQNLSNKFSDILVFSPERPAVFDGRKSIFTKTFYRGRKKVGSTQNSFEISDDVHETLP